MSEKNRKLSRRDAIKILGAATGASLLATLPSKWSKPELASGVVPAHAQTSPTLPTVLTVSIIPLNPDLSMTATFNGDVTNDGGTAILDQGFAWDFSPNNNPDLTDTVISLGPIGVGAYTTGLVFVSSTPGIKYGRAYATNAVGTGFGSVLSFRTGECLAEGTLVTLVDGSRKKIEDISYSDRLLVWNFDDGCFDGAHPLWIKRPDSAPQYNLIEFSDGSVLKTVVGHRVFNKEDGRFTFYEREDTRLGATTFTEDRGEITLLRRSVVNETVNFYNVITDRHMNLFANGILTSCGYNNLYPIRDMKFIKDDRALIPQSEFGVEDVYYEGLRLAEQDIPTGDTIAYVNRLKIRAVENSPVFA